MSARPSAIQVGRPWLQVLAFGVASGAGALAGLYGAIFTGFFATVFGGTPAQVSGPTGPMTVVMGAIVAQNAGNLAEAFTIVFLGGLLPGQTPPK